MSARDRATIDEYEAVVDCMAAQRDRALALIREAVAVHRANIAAIRDTAHRPDRVPELDLGSWYARACALVDDVDGTDG